MVKLYLIFLLDGSPNYRSNNYTNENIEWHRRSPSPLSRYNYSLKIFDYYLLNY
jgi:hypothetical protein